MTIGEIIKNRRKQLGMSAEEIADIIGTSPATIYRYESNYITKMGIDKLTPIAKALRVSEAYLMGWTSDPNWRPDSDLSQPSSPAPELELTEQQEELIKLSNNLSEEQVARILSYAQAIYDLQSDNQHPAVSISKVGEKNAAEEAEREVNRIVEKELAAAKKSIAK